MRISKIAPYATIGLVLSASPAVAQVGEADKCVKVHQIECRFSPGSGHFMYLHLENTCDRDIAAFWRVDYYNAEHPAQIKAKPGGEYGVPWGYRSRVRHLQPPRKPPADGNDFISLLPCWKRVHYVYCAEYDPDRYLSLSKSAYLEALPESACYRSIMVDKPDTPDGAMFHPVTEFYPMVGGDFYSSRFKGKAAETNHISKLPRPAAN